jgi:hypothetical protein
MPNYIDPESCTDDYDRTKCSLPFYRTHISKFEKLWNNLGRNYTMQVVELNTQFVTIDEIKRTFCVTPAWNQSWPDVERLFRSYIFKEIISTCSI